MHSAWVLRLVIIPLLPFMTVQKGENRGKAKQKRKSSAMIPRSFFFVVPVEIQGKR